MTAMATPRIIRQTPTGPVYAPTSMPKQRMPREWSGHRAKLVRVVERHPHRPLTTMGRVAPDGPAVVYAAATRDGRIKIGMSARQDDRMRRLAARLVFAIEVVREAVKDVETQALRLLGNGRGDGEYVVRVSAGQATAAIKEAYRLVGGYRHVDPALTESEARAQRINKYA